MTDLTTRFAEAWEQEIAKREAESPSFTRDQFVATGRASAAHGGKRTESYWLEEGPKMVQRWLDWREANPWQVWTLPDTGEAAIELDAAFTLPGDIYVKAYIDRVFVTPAGELVILDIKTGREPETAEQLGLYACAIEARWGVRPTWGFFWDGQKGTHSAPMLLDQYTPEYLANVFMDAVRGINAGSFIARPANNCKAWCGVARFCAAVGGSEAEAHDPALRIQCDNLNGGSKSE